MIKKKQSRHTPIIVIFLTIAVIVLVRHFHIKNFHVIEPGVLYTSGQPRGMDYTRLLYKYHIATFVNVRCADEHREENWYNEERTWVGDNGVNYVELPIERTDRARQFPNKETQQKFLKIMSAQKNLPVLVHGSSGRKRVSMLTAVWLIRSKGKNATEAIEIVEAIRDKAVTDVERRFIESLVR